VLHLITAMCIQIRLFIRYYYIRPAQMNTAAKAPIGIFVVVVAFLHFMIVEITSYKLHSAHEMRYYFLMLMLMDVVMSLSNVICLVTHVK
jgi:hypothetical protein